MLNSQNISSQAARPAASLDVASVQLEEALDFYSARVADQLKQLLARNPSPSAELNAAMEYSLLNGGKRLRPFLVYATGQLLGAKLEDLDRPATAIELIHSYSLVHDDLPAMDDDDLRRGKPTCHLAFNEATAILVGDALQTLAFQQLAHPEQPAALALVAQLATASGAQGMVGGQMLDLASEGKQLNLEELEQLHQHKTGALINAAVMLGALVAGASEEQLKSLQKFAKSLGLAFQVEDDLLDIQGTVAELGKTTGADAQLNKATYPSLLGIEAAEQLAEKLIAEACHSVENLPHQARLLTQLATWTLTRNH